MNGLNVLCLKKIICFCNSCTSTLFEKKIKRQDSQNKVVVTDFVTNKQLQTARQKRLTKGHADPIRRGFYWFL